MPRRDRTADALLDAAATLRDACDAMTFGGKVAAVYNPLNYAWPMIERYTRRFARSPVEVLLFGMNPGPWGMAQTGVPFGEVNTVRDFLKLDAPIGKPPREHPRRPITGLSCSRSEVSGARVWGLIRDRFGTPERFFEQHYIANYCPLVFMGETGVNITPDKLPASERQPLLDACNANLRAVLRVLRPKVVVGVGGWAEQRAREVVGDAARVIGILHPSPASPLANRGWAEQVTRQLIDAGVWGADTR